MSRAGVRERHRSPGLGMCDELPCEKQASAMGRDNNHDAHASQGRDIVNRDAPGSRIQPGHLLTRGALAGKGAGSAGTAIRLLCLDEPAPFASIAPPVRGQDSQDPAFALRRRGREAEGTRLLNEHTPKGYRGFESLRLRHSILTTFVKIDHLAAEVGRARTGGQARR